MVTSPQARVRFTKEPSQPVNTSILSSPDCRASLRSRSNGSSSKRRHVSQDSPASKRRRADLTSSRPYRLPVPPVRSTELQPDHREPRPPLPPRTRLVMDCVEVVPLDEVLRKREGKNGNGNSKARGAAGAREIMGAPKTPFVRRSGRTVRERLERDKIGECVSSFVLGKPDLLCQLSP